jgi:hypothetical protein
MVSKGEGVMAGLLQVGGSDVIVAGAARRRIAREEPPRSHARATGA